MSMIGYYGIVAVLLIYLHPINAQSTFITDPIELREEIFNELKARANCHKTNRIPVSSHDFVCDSLDAQRKQSVCDKIMIHMINGVGGGEFESFVQADPVRPLPTLANPFSNDPYECRRIRLENYPLAKRMYWCRPKQYKTQSGNNGEVDGFFCANVLLFTHRVYAFRPLELASDAVDPVAQIRGDDIFEIE